MTLETRFEEEMFQAIMRIEKAVLRLSPEPAQPPPPTPPVVDNTDKGPVARHHMFDQRAAHRDTGEPPSPITPMTPGPLPLPGGDTTSSLGQLNPNFGPVAAHTSPMPEQSWPKKNKKRK